MKKFILFLGLTATIISCSTNQNIPQMSAIQMKSLTTKQYEENANIINKSIASILIQMNAGTGYVPLKNADGIYNIAGHNRIAYKKKRSTLEYIKTPSSLKRNIVTDYLNYHFNITELKPNLTEVELIININGEEILYNKRNYEEIFDRLKIEIERNKMYN